jgi:hypothetical protein
MRRKMSAARAWNRGGGIVAYSLEFIARAANADRITSSVTSSGVRNL